MWLPNPSQVHMSTKQLPMLALQTRMWPQKLETTSKEIEGILPIKLCPSKMMTFVYGYRGVNVFPPSKAYSNRGKTASLPLQTSSPRPFPHTESLTPNTRMSTISRNSPPERPQVQKQSPTALPKGLRELKRNALSTRP